MIDLCGLRLLIERVVFHCITYLCVLRPWDMSRFMYLQCRASRIRFPRWATRWVNIRKTYCNSYKIPRVNVLTMLEYLGLSFEGRQHCGLDDARNIARILGYMIQDGCSIYINERMYDSKLALIDAAVSSSECDPEVVCVGQEEAEAELDTESQDEDIVDVSTTPSAADQDLSTATTSDTSKRESIERPDDGVTASDTSKRGSMERPDDGVTSCAALNSVSEIGQCVAVLNLNT